MPTNRGLQYVREQGLEFLRINFVCLEIKVEEQRGEDIPRLVNSLYEDEAPVVGITGEDFLDNFLFGEYRSSVNRRLMFKRLDLRKNGPYENTLFGLPALCILGEGGITLDKFVEAYPTVRDNEVRQLRGSELQEPDFRGKRVAIPRRYEALISSRVRLEGAEILLLDGEVDVTAARGGADYAIDIVLTGRTCREEGLGFFPPILYLSDGVILANQRVKTESVRKKLDTKRFSDWEIWFNTGRASRKYTGGGGNNFSH